VAGPEGLDPDGVAAVQAALYRLLCPARPAGYRAAAAAAAEEEERLTDAEW
jgi:hypothetical protein